MTGRTFDQISPFRGFVKDFILVRAFIATIFEERHGFPFNGCMDYSFAEGDKGFFFDGIRNEAPATAPYKVLVHQWLVKGQDPVEQPMKYQYAHPSPAPRATGNSFLIKCIVLPMSWFHFAQHVMQDKNNRFIGRITNERNISLFHSGGIRRFVFCVVGSNVCRSA